jgi:pyruvate-formate lyase-activating enzyme
VQEVPFVVFYSVCLRTVDVPEESRRSILAFFPEYQLRDVSPPNLGQMPEAYKRAKDCGLEHVRLGNIGIFVRTEEEYQALRDLS